MKFKLTKTFELYSKIVLLFLYFFFSSLKAEESVLIVEWEPILGAKEYIIEISDSKKFNKILFSRQVDEVAIIIEPDKKFKFGRIAGVDKFGSIGLFSNVFTLRPRVIASKRIPASYKDKIIYKPTEHSSNSKLTKNSENLRMIFEKKIRIKEREKTNNEIFSKILDVESNLNLIFKNIYLQRSKLNELELEVLEKENLNNKDLETIINEASQILDSLKNKDRETSSLVTPIQQEAKESQKILSQHKLEIEKMNGKLFKKIKKEKPESSQLLEEKFIELKTYSEEEVERMEDLLREINSLNKKKSLINKRIKNFKKEIIYFQSITEDLKRKNSEPTNN